MPANAELGSKQIAKATVMDILRGRSLRVPDSEGGTFRLRVNTLKPNFLGDKPKDKPRNRKRLLFFVGDYNDDDARGRVKQALTREVPEKRYCETVDVDVDRYATLSGSYEIAQASVYGVDTSKTLVYYNIAPRGANGGDENNHQAIGWKGEERQGLIFAVTDKGVPVIGVNSGFNFSLIKDHIVAAWSVDFSHDERLQQILNETQFRSLNVYPEALAILRSRKGRRFIGKKLDIEEAIPDAPCPIIEDDGKTLTTNILYVDGRNSEHGGYHNQKLLLRESDLPNAIKTSKTLAITVNGKTREFVNTLAYEGQEKPNVSTNEFFLTKGSSGDPKDPWLEANQMYAPAAEVFGVDKVTDATKITIRAVG